MPTMIREDGIATRIAEELLGNIVSIRNGKIKTATKRKKRRYISK